MTNGTDTTKFKLSGTDKVDDIGKESRAAPKLLTVSEKGLIIKKKIERAVDILMDEVICCVLVYFRHTLNTACNIESSLITGLN